MAGWTSTESLRSSIPRLRTRCRLRVDRLYPALRMQAQNLLLLTAAKLLATTEKLL
jgi:hypothetical protein